MQKPKMTENVSMHDLSAWPYALNLGYSQACIVCAMCCKDALHMNEKFVFLLDLRRTLSAS